MLRGAAQIRIDDEDIVAALGAGEGEVVDRRGLALAGTAADEGEGIGVAEGFVEFDVRAEDAVGLGVGGIAGRFHEHGNFLGDDGEHRDLEEALDVVEGLHAGVEVFDEEGEADPDNEADGCREAHESRHVRPGRGE